MKKFKWFNVLIVVCLVTLLAACQNPLTMLLGDREDLDVSLIIDHGEHAQDGMRETVLYYRDEKGMLIPVMKKIPWEEGIARGALRKLVDEEFLREDLQAVGLLPILPEDTEVIGISINDGLSKVDFNEKLLNYATEVEEQAIVQSIVYTLTEFESIDQVQILVNGEVLNQLKFGTRVDLPLQRENINLSGIIDDNNIPVVVYYKSTNNGMDSYYVPVTKRIQGLKVDIKSAIVAQLEGAPEGSGLYSELPEGVLVNDVFVKEGIAYIDFTAEIKRMPNNKDLQQSLVYELGFTLKEIEPSISQVRILSGGSEIELSSGVNLNLPSYTNPF
ncbi:GerMN domain-containing protein [Alkaliphilus transvaalensis]|uniref:GerMN domain-containing protein n=1 Tax=Alkaliphilus transvaalensis TaxID=114628 RepID=UPI00047AAC52|nr:GerMN domain-containing protein [Alkaliphilus transvaalensis]